MFLLDSQSFISCFSDPQAWHNFSLFCGTESKCLVQLSHNKLKSEIFNDKKVYKQKHFSL